ncbi:TPA: hypothetical protein H5W49_001633 [Escherichia coli]|nr:hypothetical protein [Escherichia coli]HAL1780005.1 hypothetical protein [Escherichia coli]HAX2071915.1 hypothetical protein [Escherichia coli]
MGWSKPKIPTSKDVQRWSPWVCLFILFAGAFVALTYGILHSPADGLPALASGYWLPLTGRMMAGVMTALTGYLLWWEFQAYYVWCWNSRRHSALLVWQQRAHQHRYLACHVLLTSDTQLLPRLAGTSYKDNNNDPPLTLLAEEPLIPGIARFEQLCQLLINQIKASLIQHYPSGQMTVLIETSASDKERERTTLIRLWKEDELPWILDIHMSPTPLPLSDENNHLFDIDNPVLVLALHYRQPEENLPEFASALLLLPPELLKVSIRRDTVRVFRPMPLNIDAISRELTELRDMAQQPVNARYLVWHSGLTQASQQALGRVVNDLPLSLHNDIATGGIIDVDKVIAAYGPPAGWLMVATAAEMVRYGPGSHWLLQVRNKQASAVVTGNGYPAINQEYLDTTSSPYPAGSLMLAVMLNILVLWFIGRYSQEWLFSWAGVAMTLLLMIVTLPGIVFGLRSAVAHLQYPRFIQAIVRAQKE